MLECPSGSCCKAGGKYIEKACSVGLECCIDNGYIIEHIENDNNDVFLL